MKIIYNKKPNIKLKYKIFKTLNVARKTLGQPCNISVEINFVDKAQIHELNKKFRNIDKETDVLSFPMLDIRYGTILDKKYLDYKEKKIFLGSVFVCGEIAYLQSQEYGHSLEREIVFLILHGFLHLLGYDHVEKEDEEIMMLIAKRVLDKVNIKRGEVSD